MTVDRNKYTELIWIGIILAALLALAGALLSLEFGFITIMEATILYLALTVLVSGACYLIAVYFLRMVGIFSNWQIIIITTIIFMGSMLEIGIIAKLVRPWIYSQAGMELTSQPEQEFLIYALIGATMLIISVIWAVENVRRKYLEKINPKVDFSLDKNMTLHVNFK